ncbi:hypothetical protein K432DRAFT_7582 [Lepidopterella palustris CBS 459.81]|uniref:Uncharacterized protein n=1 Tax=Lepidopterella palustris CBS 459.81 TaxID=1314670 RepID=A0A8E2JGS3_9PEZI|nr:hypothetical protein K432DRAFT_7582 [Lepidopterella palustris CBS 459.81]
MYQRSTNELLELRRNGLFMRLRRRESGIRVRPIPAPSSHPPGYNLHISTLLVHSPWLISNHRISCWTDFCPGATDVVCMQSLEIHDLCVAANMAPPVFKDYACPTTFSDMPTSASYLPASTAAGSPAMSKAATTAAGSVAGSTATAAAKTSTAGAAFVHGSPIMGAVLPIGGVLAFGIVGLAMFL